MKSIEQYLDEEGFQTWFDNEAGEMVISVEDLKQAIQEYAKQTAIAQREACSESSEVKYIHYPLSVDCVVDVESILNTKLVVD